MAQVELKIEALLEHREFVRAMARRVLRNSADIDEVEQQTWLSALRGHGSAPSDLRGWLVRVVRNHSLNLVRSRKRVAEREQASAVTEAQWDSRLLERMEISRLIVKSVMELPEERRTVVLLRFHDGHSPRVIANQLGLKVDTVRSRIRAGVTQIRSNLEASSRHHPEGLRGALAALLVPAAGKSVSVAGSGIALVAAAAVALMVIGGWSLGVLEAPNDSNALEFRSSKAPESKVLEANRVAHRATIPLAFAVAPITAQLSTVSKGEVTLRIGDAFVFGEKGPIPDRERSTLDLYCQDIRHGISLSCPQGAMPALSPMTSIGLPRDPNETFKLLTSAPLVLSKRDLWLYEHCDPKRIGLGLVAARNGKVYKLCLLELHPHPEALKRWVRVGYEAVERVNGGGELGLPRTHGQPSKTMSEAIRRALARGATVPGQTFHSFMDGDYGVVENLLPVTALRDREHIVVPHRLQTEIAIDSRAAVFALDGIVEGGKVAINRYGAVGVLGDMNGEITVNSYGYAYLDGDLYGTLRIKSYATVYLTGNVYGTLKVRSYTDLYLKGRVFGKLDAKGSCWSTFYFDGHHSQAELAAMGGSFKSITLHVKSSDLKPGTYENIGSWRKVIVGDDVWATLGK
ncbi:MAG: RNA polymerase sigma factor [Planctomycetota bacterium]